MFNRKYRIIITGTTGMVGEGVLLECLSDERVAEVLSVSRKTTTRSHPKLKEYIVPDFLQLNKDDTSLHGYDACFYCAGVSSVGMKEPVYTRITYDTTLHFAKLLLQHNPQMVFGYVSGAGTDSSEKGGIMWARVKGRTENALLQLPFKKVKNYRPGFLKPIPGQQNVLRLYQYLGLLFPFFRALMPHATSTLQQLGRAMINSIEDAGGNQVLEVKDINLLSARS